jgi:hypothetical protein
MRDIISIVSSDFLANALDEGLVVVEFEKRNGDMRLMLCTTNADMMPSLNDYPKEWPDNSDGELFTVYDLEKNAWRRFNYSTLNRVLI